MCSCRKNSGMRNVVPRNNLVRGVTGPRSANITPAANLRAAAVPPTTERSVTGLNSEKIKSRKSRRDAAKKAFGR